jgi:hypothetical protein
MFLIPLICKPKTETVLIHSLEPKAKVFSKSQRTIPTQEYISVVVATPLWPNVRMKLTLPKLGTWSPLGLPKTQSLIAGVKTPRVGAFLISLESSSSVDVQNGLA